MSIFWAIIGTVEFPGWGGFGPNIESVTKYKCSIIQTEQNTTDVDKIQIEQNAKIPKYNDHIRDLLP